MSDEEVKGLLPLVEDVTLSDSEEEVNDTISPLDDGEKHMDSSDYYWNSYAHFGIHEVR